MRKKAKKEYITWSSSLFWAPFKLLVVVLVIVHHGRHGRGTHTTQGPTINEELVNNQSMKTKLERVEALNVWMFEHFENTWKNQDHVTNWRNKKWEKNEKKIQIILILFMNLVHPGVHPNRTSWTWTLGCRFRCNNLPHRTSVFRCGFGQNRPNPNRTGPRPV